MTVFQTATEAQAYIQDTVDVPVAERTISLGSDAQFRACTQELADGRFTNIYDVSCPANKAFPAVHVHDGLTSIYNFAKSRPNMATMGGSFFFLADVASSLPRQLALNFAAVDRNVRSLPVVDREAVVVHGNAISAQFVRSLGVISINGQDLSWSGSLTEYDTDAKVFGNGNANIRHENNAATGSIRVLDENSRFTPPIYHDEMVDIGFIGRPDGVFVVKNTSVRGGVDIFAHDVVLRCGKKYLAEDMQMKIHTVGSLAIDGPITAALSAGPMLKTRNFEAHSINKDASLGSKPPFLEYPLARTVLYESEDGRLHMRIFDGRPGSREYTGVTPSEAASIIHAEGDTAWGCFLDGGQTAKLCVRVNKRLESHGNKHYLKWAPGKGNKYIWAPKIGRPTASAITLQ